MDSLYTLLKGIFFIGGAKIDNWGFRYSYWIFCPALLSLSFFTLLNHFSTEKIHCVGGPSSSKDELDVYCLSTTKALYILHQYTEGQHDAHNYVPGVILGNQDDDKDKRYVLLYYAFYHWIILGFSLMLYLPKFVWTAFENKKIENLIQDLPNESLSAEKRADQRNIVAKYMIDNINKTHSNYFGVFFTCETMNHLLTISIFFLVGYILGTWTYGVSYTGLIQDPLLKNCSKDFNIRQFLFPTAARCARPRVGEWFADVHIDKQLCFLPLNAFNAHIFLVIWILSVIGLFVSTLSILCRLCLFLPICRKRLLLSQTPTVQTMKIEKIVAGIGIADCYVLSLVGSNIQLRDYARIIDKIYTKIIALEMEV